MNRHLWALGGKQEAEGTQSMSVYDGIPSRGKPVTKDGAPRMADGVGGPGLSRGGIMHRSGRR